MGETPVGDVGAWPDAGWRQSLDAAGAAAGAAGAGVLLAELLEELPPSELVELLVDGADFDADEPPRLSVL